MLAFVVKLTRTPGRMTRDDSEDLRAHGFDDAALLDITQVAAYYAYVNRLADGLGVELEEYWTPDTLTLTREAFEARKRDAPGGGFGERGTRG